MFWKECIEVMIVLKTLKTSLTLPILVLLVYYVMCSMWTGLYEYMRGFG